MAPGHMIPMIDIAKLLARRGVIATIVTTPHNAIPHKATIHRAAASGLPIRLLQLGCYDGLFLQPQLEESLADADPKPNCLISDVFHAWTCSVASKLEIPRIVKLPAIAKKGNGDHIHETEQSAYGVLVNSFDELEPEYAKQYREARQGKVWCIGPVSLVNKEELDIAERGNKTSIDKNKCLEWLDSREPNSVMYVCLGSLCRLTAKQLIEIGMALESSEHPFVWVFRIDERYRELESWLDREGYEERNKGRGLVIRGWAPQVMILSHGSVGGFLTHCGWNSTLEAVRAGVPMLTWPMYAEQFLNEKVIVEVLKVGYSGVEWLRGSGKIEVVKKAEIERGVRRLMDESSEECEEMRRRVEEIGEMGRRAMEDGGTSHFNLSLFIQDIVDQTSKKNN
ncbi:hypothetical protein Syun_000677 [Stephania yunnanensis]|uniref:Glycosyltransferase n=1 Tax=Stephania yunnanensis TaxID=152371 RepID=A0AAP0LCC0_9MAGN